MKLRIILIVLGLILVICLFESDAKIRRRKLKNAKLSNVHRHKTQKNIFSKPKRRTLVSKLKRTIKTGPQVKPKRRPKPLSAPRRTKTSNSHYFYFDELQNDCLRKKGHPDGRTKFSKPEQCRKHHARKRNPVLSSPKTAPKKVKPKTKKIRRSNSVEYRWIKIKNKCLRKRMPQRQKSSTRAYLTEKDCKKSFGKKGRLQGLKSSKTGRLLRLKVSKADKDKKDKKIYYFNKEKGLCKERLTPIEGVQTFDSMHECEENHKIETNEIVDPSNPKPETANSKPETARAKVETSDPNSETQNENTETTDSRKEAWIRAKNGCFKTRIPISEMGRSTVFSSYELCNETKPMQEVYVFNGEKNTCEQISVQQVKSTHYSSFQDCKDKNIAFYYQKVRKACEKWKMDSDGQSNKMFNFSECVDYQIENNIRKRVNNYYCIENSECIWSNQFKRRRCYETRRECLAYKGRLFFVYEAELKKCVLSVDPSGYHSRDDCIYANRKMLSPQKNGTAHFYDKLYKACRPLKEGQATSFQVYRSLEECARENKASAQLSVEVNPRTTIKPVKITIRCGNSVDHFRCSNGKCRLKQFVCNGMDDCGDNSDEENCTLEGCAADEFLCIGDAKCIPLVKVCDEVSDCLDGSDEDDC